MVEREKEIYLCTPQGKKLCVLNGIEVDSVSYNSQLKDYNHISFTVDRYVSLPDGTKVESNGYNDLHAYMTIEISGLDRFQIQEPTTENNYNTEKKLVEGYSLEKELEDKDLTNFLINQCTTNSREMLIESNVSSLGTPIQFMKIFSDTNKELSVIDMCLKELPLWSVGHVDSVFWDYKCPPYEIDNTNVYAFLTSNLAPRINGVFVFDSLNRKVNLYSLTLFGENTNVFIGLRNLAKSVKVYTNEDSIYTRFTVRGDNDLNVRDVNYMQEQIYNLDYFKNTKYMPQTLIDKLNSLENYRETNRETFINLSKSWTDLNDKIKDIQYRVPNDGLNTDQWDGMTEDLLNKSLQAYELTLTLLQESVDPNENGNPRYTKNADGSYTYTPWKKTNGEVDHDKYLNLLYNLENGYGGYYTYIEINTYIIPNIKVAIENLKLSPDDKKDYNTNFETNFSLYGITELQAKLDLYEKEIVKGSLSNYAKSWDELTPDEKAKYSNEEANYNIYHDKYVKYTGYIGTETTLGTVKYYLKKLNDELAGYQNSLKNVEDQRLVFNKNVVFAEGTMFNFTADDLKIISLLLHDTDYTNSNIFTTSIDNTLTTIDVESDLLNDAVDKLSEVNHPQYNFETQVDNLLALDEFSVWKSDFVLGNFVWLGVRDDYSVKLRLTGMEYNPCIKTDNLTVEFSSMITSRSGRSDLSYFIDGSGRSSKNGISYGTGGSGSGGTVDSALLNQILTALTNSNIFKNIVGDNTDVTLDEDEVRNILEKYLATEQINVNKIVGNEADFLKLFSEYIDSDFISSRIIVTDEFKAALAEIDVAKIGQVFSESLQTLMSTTATSIVNQEYVTNLVANNISVGDLKALEAEVQQIKLITVDGQPAISFLGATQQFYDKDGNIRVQIGQDAEGNFNFIVRGADGKSALFDENGVTKDAIADGLIINDMVEEGTLSKDKLGFEIIEPNEYGGVDISKIYDGSGGSFGVEYTSFKETTNNSISDLQDNIDELALLSQGISLSASVQVFTKTNNVISPTTITINALVKNTTVAKWYINGELKATSGTSIIVTPNMLQNKTITVRAENTDGSAYDTYTVYLVTDGENGSDAYTAYVTSSQGTSFKEGTTVTNTVLTCQVYKGGTAIEPTAYKWLMQKDDNSAWVSIGTSKTVSVLLNSFNVQERIKCEFTI